MKSTATKTEQHNMTKKLQSLDTEYLQESIKDCNTPLRRFFRCWLDGSYKGFEHYQDNVFMLSRHHDKPKVIRGYVICEFCDYIAHEYDCSTSTVRQHMTNSLTTEELEQFNAELIDDALDLVRDQLEEVA